MHFQAKSYVKKHLAPQSQTPPYSIFQRLRMKQTQGQIQVSKVAISCKIVKKGWAASKFFHPRPQR
jgi:hypothetical protein